jgi:hypothetical protein
MRVTKVEEKPAQFTVADVKPGDVFEVLGLYAGTYVRTTTNSDKSNCVSVNYWHSSYIPPTTQVHKIYLECELILK